MHVCLRTLKTEVMHLNPGDPFPAFTLPDHNGRDFDLGLYLGKSPLVIYFYPKNETPGCTREACLFRDKGYDFERYGALIIGISSDSATSHQQFRSHHRLDFPLLSDANGKIRKLLGIKPDFMGLLPARVTFVVDAKGNLVNTFRSQWDVNGHIESALHVLEKLKK